MGRKEARTSNPNPNQELLTHWGSFILEVQRD